MYIGFHLKYLLFLSDFNKTWIFSSDFPNKTLISNFMKIRPVGADRHDESYRRFFDILRTRLKTLCGLHVSLTILVDVIQQLIFFRR
jgi:hypothetical protein